MLRAGDYLDPRSICGQPRAKNGILSFYIITGLEKEECKRTPYEVPRTPNTDYQKEVVARRAPKEGQHRECKRNVFHILTFHPKREHCGKNQSRRIRVQKPIPAKVLPHNGKGDLALSPLLSSLTTTHAYLLNPLTKLDRE